MCLDAEYFTTWALWIHGAYFAFVAIDEFGFHVARCVGHKRWRRAFSRVGWQFRWVFVPCLTIAVSVAVSVTYLLFALWSDDATEEHCGDEVSCRDLLIEFVVAHYGPLVGYLVTYVIEDALLGNTRRGTGRRSIGRRSPVSDPIVVVVCDDDVDVGRWWWRRMFFRRAREVRDRGVSVISRADVDVRVGYRTPTPSTGRGLTREASRGTSSPLFYSRSSCRILWRETAACVVGFSFSSLIRHVGRVHPVDEIGR